LMSLFVTLILVPSLYLVLDSFKLWLKSKFSRLRPRHEQG